MEPPSSCFFFSRRNDQQLRIKRASGFLRRRFEPCADRVGARRFDQRALPVFADFAEFTRPVADLNCFLAIISFTGDLHIAPLAENSWVHITSSVQSWGKAYWSGSGAPPKSPCLRRVMITCDPAHPAPNALGGLQRVFHSRLHAGSDAYPGACGSCRRHDTALTICVTGMIRRQIVNFRTESRRPLCSQALPVNRVCL